MNTLQLILTNANNTIMGAYFAALFYKAPRRDRLILLAAAITTSVVAYLVGRYHV